MNPTTRAALEACQAIFDRDPEAAQPLDEVDRIMRLSTGDGPYDLVRHVFGPEGRVFFRLYPDGAKRGVEIAPDVTVKAEVYRMLATARPVGGGG